MKFSNLRLSVKQSINSGLVLFIMAIATLYSIDQMESLKEGVDALATNWLKRTLAISTISQNTGDLHTRQLQLTFATSEADKMAYQKAMGTLIDNIDYNLEAYKSLKASLSSGPHYAEDEEANYAAFEEKWETYQDLCFKIHEFTREGRIQPALDLLNGEAQDVFIAFRSDLETLVWINFNAAQEAADSAEATFRSTRKRIMLLLALTVVVSLVVALGLMRYITGPIALLAKAAHQVADGDLKVELTVSSQDEIGDLTHSFNQMTTSLRLAAAENQSQAAKLQQANEVLRHQSQDLEANNRALKETNRQLAETKDQLVMQEKMASLGNLVAGVAHEINNPVGAVNSATQTSSRALQKIVDAQTDESQPQLNRFLKILVDSNRVIALAGERIARVVRHLKDFARLDEAEFQFAQIHDGIDSTLELLQHMYKDRVTIDKRYGDLPPIQCYPNQLNQVFMNVLANGVQAIDGNGTIIINTALEGDQIRVKISDSGVGIPPEKVQHIFDPGFTTKGVGVGTGLGLSISYNIIQRHQGRFEVDSQMGKGTDVSIILPLEPVPDMDA